MRRKTEITGKLLLALAAEVILFQWGMTKAAKAGLVEWVVAMALVCAVLWLLDDLLAKMRGRRSRER